MKTETGHLNEFRKALFLLLINGGETDVMVKRGKGKTITLKNVSLRYVGRQCWWEGRMATSLFIDTDLAIEESKGQTKVLDRVPPMFTLEDAVDPELWRKAIAAWKDVENFAELGRVYGRGERAYHVYEGVEGDWMEAFTDA